MPLSVCKRLPSPKGDAADKCRHLEAKRHCNVACLGKQHIRQARAGTDDAESRQLCKQSGEQYRLLCRCEREGGASCLCGKQHRGKWASADICCKDVHPGGGGRLKQPFAWRACGQRLAE